jgi:hypothetical protein
VRHIDSACHETTRALREAPASLVKIVDMLRTSIVIALALLVAPACKKKEGEGGKPAEGAKTDKPAEGAAKPAESGGAPAMEAPALFADYNAPGQDGLALMKKWENGVAVSGTVKRVITEEAGNVAVWLDGGDKNNVSLGFTDEGKAAKDKGVKEGDKVSAQCKIGGASGTLMMLIDCVLK